MDHVNGTTVRVAERTIDSRRPLRVVIVGAGISGLVSTIKLLQTNPGLDIVIYDKNQSYGGTWFENRYPGVACGTT